MKVQYINPAWGAKGLDPFVVGGGILGILLGIFHLRVHPSQCPYQRLHVRNIETELSSSISAIFLSITSSSRNYCMYYLTNSMDHEHSQQQYRTLLILPILWWH